MEKEMVHLSVENSVAFAYLKRGRGKFPHFNHIMRDFWHCCMKKKIQVQVELIPSAEYQADYWSRTPQDHGDYMLDKNLFQFLRKKLHPYIVPTMDMFASPGNHQLKHFVSRYPHWEADRQDALNCPLWDITHCYTNPPWKLISEWLNRLWLNPHLTCMMITPYWVGAPWWPQLVKLQCPHTPSFLIHPYWGMFTNSLGQFILPPRWPLVCTVLSGKIG